MFADVKILKLKFSQDLKLEFGQYFVDVEILKLVRGQYSEDEI